MKNNLLKNVIRTLLLQGMKIGTSPSFSWDGKSKKIMRTEQNVRRILFPFNCLTYN